MLSLRSILTAVALYSAGALGAPVTIEERGISSSLLSTFNLMEQYAAAAYCSGNFDTAAANEKVSCSAGSCPLVEAAATNTVSEFENSLITDVTGFVAVDSTNKLVVVSFRGSDSLKNWIADLTFNTVAVDICSGCTAHAGFWASWVEARTGVLAAIKSTAKQYPDFQLVVVGHSLGGAIAALAAAELRNDGYTAALYTFGQPRIAGTKLSEYITNQPGGNYRVTHYNDPVPQLPTLDMGFVHISPEYYISTGNSKQVTANDINVLQGDVNYNGNTAWVLTDIVAHLWYFNSVCACSSALLSLIVKF